MIWKSIELKAFFTLAGIVAAMAIPTIYSIVADTKPNSPMDQSKIETPSEPAQRGIASVPTEKLEDLKTENKFAMVLDYHCKEDSEVVVSAQTLRFKGISDGCLSNQWKDISIVNETNGFTAEVIFQKEKFTTDFIDLKEGANKLVLKATDLDGNPIERKIHILKRSMASVPEQN